MNEVFARQRGKAHAVLDSYREGPVAVELEKSHFPGATVLGRLVMALRFFLAGERRDVVDECLAASAAAMAAYWLDHSCRRASDGSPMSSDRANAELASYFIKSLSAGAIEPNHLVAFFEFKMRWLEELNEVPPRSDDTDGIWRRMVLVALELGDVPRAAALFGRRRRYRNEQRQYAPLKAFFEGVKGKVEKTPPEQLWHEYFLEARRRPAGCGKTVVIHLDELLLVASLDQSGLAGERPRDHWAALRAMRGPDEIEPD